MPKTRTKSESAKPPSKTRSKIGVANKRTAKKEPLDQTRDFPIVGVGASAGGLEAFRLLLEALPLDTGMGFVLVQHLDPVHENQLTQILSRSTLLPVHEISNDERVQPDHVYVIPRDTNLTIKAGTFKLQPRDRSRNPHRSVDTFFESLALDSRERAVGVVLSGTANDGTLGLEAIKAEGGITFAQDDSAKHAAMPRSAVAAGCVDLVLPPAEIAKELARIAKHPYVAGQALRLSDPEHASSEDDRASAITHQNNATALPSGGSGETDSGAEQAWAEANDETGNDKPKPSKRDSSGYKKILLLLRNHSGVDFSLYKSNTIQRRIARRLVLSRHNTLPSYASFLRGNNAELDALYSDVLISVTSFFRNHDTFEVLQQKVLPQLLKQTGDDPLRCWVLGCSTGQEAYSIAIAFAEVVAKAPRMRTLQIFATDLNDTLLEKARQGLYAKTLAEDISPERLQRFFVEEEGGYRVSKPLREMVVFARQNLIADPPFSRMDLISCRNLLIYLEASLQKKALPTFHYALKPGGFLLLGASESIGGFTELFEPVDKRHKIYSKKPTPITSLHLPVRKEHTGEPPSPHTPLPMRKRSNLELSDGIRSEVDATREADRISVTQFAPPGVLVNAEFQVLQFRGRTSAFLEPPVGKASFDVLKMAREGLMLPLRTALNQVKNDNKPVRKENIKVKRGEKTRSLNLEIIPLKNLRERCFLVLFQWTAKARPGREVAKSKPVPKDRTLAANAGPTRIAELESELAEMREYIHSMREQHEAAHEEIQSANEEVQSANEELQSINEELETSKEELESANEELITVNEEMSHRNIELNRLNNDLINLQVSTKLAIVLFGRDLSIRRFSPQAEKQFDLLVADVGQPISHLRHNLVESAQVFPTNSSEPGLFTEREVPVDLSGIVAGVIADVREQEREVVDKSGRRQILRVRPYMTSDAKVDGAVLVLVDVDQLKRSEQANSRLAAIVESSDDAIISTTLSGSITSWNGGAEKLFGYSNAEAVGRHISLIIPVERRPEEEAVLAQLRRGDKLAPLETERLGKDEKRIPISLTTSPIKDAAGQIIGISRASRDISERKRVEHAMRESQENYRALVEQVKDYAIFRTDTQGRATTWNEGVKRILGFGPEEFLSLQITESIFTEEDILAGVPQRELETATKYGAASNDRWMRRKNGEHFFAAGITTALREDGYQVSGFTKVMRDQTVKMQSDDALRRSEEQLKQYAKELSEAALRKNEFLAMLGHELRNPLAALSHGLDLLGKVSDDGARAEELRGMMTRQTTRIVALLDQLLDIARVISGKVELSKKRVDLTDAVTAAVETVQPIIDAQGHELILKLPSKERLLVVGDAVRLTQVIENILTNAAKYTNKGGRIELTLERVKNTARITVRDNGIGMSAELLPHVFEVFTQAPRTLDRAKGGMGLGLPLVQRLIEMHDGLVTAESPGPDQGSSFIITLPCTSQSRFGASERPPKSAPVFAPPSKVSALRILVVDDETDTAETLAELLQEDGHTAIAVNDGRSALEAARNFNPEVVLLDLGLPEMDGYEVARKLRDEHNDKKMLLVAVTGYQSDAVRLKQAGFDEHLIKPPHIRRLAALLAQWATDKEGDA